MSYTEELMFIKRVQREFKQRFGKNLPVDFPKLKGLRLRASIDERFNSAADQERQMDELLAVLCKQYDTTIEQVREKKYLQAKDSFRERAVVQSFCQVALELNWDLKLAAAAVKRDRSLFYKMR